jgi:predicted RND superfamily exporter protein
MLLFTKLADLARRYPRAVLGLITALTLLFGYGLAHLRIANDPQDFLPNRPEVQSYRQIERDFGTASFTRKLYVRFAPHSGYSIDSPESVLEQEHVLEALHVVPGIVAANGLPDWVKELRREMHGGDPAYATLPLQGDAQLGYSFADLIRLTFQRLSFAKQYVSDDGTAIVVAQIDPQADLATVARATDATLAPLQQQATATDMSLMTYGTALDTFNQITYRDLELFAPFTLGLVSLLLLWLFGRRRGINLCLILTVIGLAGIWKLGLLGLIGLPLNFLLVSTIPLIIGVGIDYPIHLLHRYEEERQETKGTQAMGTALSRSTPMLLANTLTTVAGFSSLLLTQSLPIQTFGLLFSFAMIANFLLTLTLIPAIKQLQAEGWSLEKSHQAGVVARAFGQYCRIISTKRLIGATVLLLILLVGLGLLWEGRTLRLQASDLRRMLPSDASIVQVYNQIDREFLPYDQTQLLIRGDLGRLPLMRAQLTEIPMALAGSPYTRQVRGIARLIDDMRNANPQMEQGFMSRFVNEGPDSAYHWALDYLFARPDLASRASEYVRRDAQGAYIEAIVRIDTARYTAGADLQLVTADIDDRLAPIISELEKAGYQVELTGTPFVEQASLQAVQQSFLASRAFAFVLSFLLVAWVLRSLLWGFIVILPMLPITGVELAAIRALGIEINAFTAVVGAVSIGLGVTYAIPLIVRFREGGDPGKDLATTGKAISAAYLSTVAAFMALLLGGIAWNIDFGLLAGVAISSAYLITMLALPVLVGLVPQSAPRTLPESFKEGVNHEVHVNLETDHLGRPAGASAPGMGGFLPPGPGHRKQ